MPMSGFYSGNSFNNYFQPYQAWYLFKIFLKMLKYYHLRQGLCKNNPILLLLIWIIIKQILEIFFGGNLIFVSKPTLQ